MYHIPNDKRAINSANLIAEGLMKCLKEKDFSKISITDINLVSFVSRATFYRLFDNTIDVLAYQCDQMFERLIYEFDNMDIRALDEFFIYFIKQSMEHELLFETIVTSNHIDVLYATHIKYKNTLKDKFLSECVLTDSQMDCIISVLTVSLCSLLTTWIKNGRIETPEQLYLNIKECFKCLDHMFNT
jgi:AcrR family transcriptional regulator